MSREVVVLETTMGSISFELYTDHAPRTVANFRELARKGYYSGERQSRHCRAYNTDLHCDLIQVSSFIAS